MTFTATLPFIFIIQLYVLHLHNGKVLLSGGDLRNYGSTLAQKFNSSSIAEIGTSAPLEAIQCYRQALNVN